MTFVQASVQVSTYDLAQITGVLFVVRDLAAEDPYRAGYFCAHCHQEEDEPHDPGCVWQRAKDIVDSGALDSRADKVLAAMEGTE